MSDEPRDPNDAPGDGAARPSDREIHGAGDPPRDALADATRRLVVDDREARHGIEPDPRDPTPGSGLRPPDDPTRR